MTLAQGFVVLSAADADAPATPGLAIVSTTDAWDDGGFAIGAAAAARGALVVDRPYFTGNPTVEWFVAQANRATEAGMWVQVGNEQNLELEGWVGGPEAWFAFEEAVLASVERPDRMLAMPPSPGVAGWADWVSLRGPYAVHAYGSFDQMRAVVQQYLDETEDDLYVTECNFGAGNAVDVDTWAGAELAPFLDWCAAQARVRLCAYFAWRWRGAPPMPTRVDAAGTAVATIVADWTAPINGGNGGSDGEVFSIEAARDQLWTIADALERNGWAWYGQGIKALTSLSKGER